MSRESDGGVDAGNDVARLSSARLVLAAGWHLLAGALWLAVLGSGLAEAWGAPAAAIWVGSAVVLWFRSAARMVRAVEQPRTAWGQSFEWWLQSLLAPVALAIVLYRAATGRSEGDVTEAEAVASDALLTRIDRLERELRRLQAELAEVKALARLGETGTRTAPEPPLRVAPTPPTPLRPRAPERAASPPPPPAPPTARPRTAAAPPPAPPAREPKPAWWERIDTADLLGARALAWAGGVVTLLGVVFFFVLAVNRGWIGPVERVALGGLASALVFGAGIFVKRRHGELYSALAAVAAGLAGGFATLLAAAALYELVPDLAALAIAAGLAAVGVAIALAWSAQTVAGLGLIGAMLVPVMVVFEGGLSVVGTGFAGLLLAATAVVAIVRRWRGLLAVGAFVAAAQIAVLVAQEGEGASAAVVAVAAGFWLLYLAIGIAEQRRSGSAALDRLATSLLLWSATLAASSAGVLLNGTTYGIEREGAALLAAASVYGVLAALVFRRPRQRDLSAFLSALGLALAAIGLADVLGGTTLAAVWAAQAAILAWLAHRVREIRFAAGAVAYLLLVLGHVLVVDAPLEHLYSARSNPAAGALAVLALAASALLVARFAGLWPPAPEEERTDEWWNAHPLRAAFAAFADGRVRISAAATFAAALAALYATSLAVLELFQRAGVREAFEWGHVAVDVVWALAAAATLLAGARLRRRALELAGLAWLGVTVLNVLVFDLPSLGEPQRAYAALAVAASVLLAGYAYALVREPAPDAGRIAAVTSAISVALAAFAVVELVGGEARGVDLQGLAFLAAAGVYAALAVPVFGRPGRRGLSTSLWVPALALALVAWPQLLSGTALAGAWSVTATALAWLGARSREPRLALAALAFAGAVSLHVPLTPETHHLIDAAALAAMRPGAVLVNTSRGAVVDEDALVRALEEGRLAGAALDVYEREPEVHAGLLRLENVLLTPHLGSATVEAREAMGMLCVEALRAVLVEARRPRNAVNPEAWRA